MTELPLVSCVLATYNFAPFLARSIESVLEQEYPASRMQVIVVDDGSQDETPVVIEPYLDRITYIRKANGGLRSTVNRGLAEARGELIALQSGDDVWMPNRLRVQVAEMMARPELGLHYADMRVIDGDDQPIAESFWAAYGISPVRGRPVARLMRGNVISGGTLMVRSSLREHFEPLPEFAPWEDWWIALSVARVAEIDFIETPVYGYRRHGGNMNLGADAARAVEIAAAELPFRRWMLTDLESELVTAQEWVAVYQEWANALCYVASGRGDAIEGLAAVEDCDRKAGREAAREAGLHLAAGDTLRAARESARALGHDPFGEEAQQALRATMERMERMEHAPRPPDDLEARAFVTLADAEELIADPALLAAYGEIFTGADDASLLVLVAEERIQALSAVVDKAGLGGDDGPDLVGMPVPPDAQVTAAATLAGTVHAVLSRRAPAGALAIHPHADELAVARLRQLAERRWASKQASRPCAG